MMYHCGTGDVMATRGAAAPLVTSTEMDVDEEQEHGHTSTHGDAVVHQGQRQVCIGCVWCKLWGHCTFLSTTCTQYTLPAHLDAV